VLHRDLKPSNLLVTQTYGLKITDFGCSRVRGRAVRRQPRGGGGARGGGDDAERREDDAASDASASDGESDDSDGLASETMTSVGTLIYCAPEVLRGERYSEAADVFSFAMTLAAMALDGGGGGGDAAAGPEPLVRHLERRFRAARAPGPGARPPRGGAAAAAAAVNPAIITNAIALHGLRPELDAALVASPALRALVERCWAAEPGRRPSFERVLHALEGDVRACVMRTATDEPPPPSPLVAAAGAGARRPPPPRASREFHPTRALAALEDGDATREDVGYVGADALELVPLGDGGGSADATAPWREPDAARAPCEIVRVDFGVPEPESVRDVSFAGSPSQYVDAATLLV
jgi:hypothetical protein